MQRGEVRCNGMNDSWQSDSDWHGQLVGAQTNSHEPHVIRVSLSSHSGWEPALIDSDLSLQKTGGHSISSLDIQVRVSSFLPMLFTRISLSLTSRFCPQHDSIRTVPSPLTTPASSYRCDSSSTRPPSQPCLIRCGCGKYNEYWNVHPVGSSIRNPTRYYLHNSRDSCG